MDRPGQPEEWDRSVLSPCETPSYIPSGLGSSKFSSKKVNAQKVVQNGEIFVWPRSIKDHLGALAEWAIRDHTLRAIELWGRNVRERSGRLFPQNRSPSHAWPPTLHPPPSLFRPPDRPLVAVLALGRGRRPSLLLARLAGSSQSDRRADWADQLVGSGGTRRRG